MTDDDVGVLRPLARRCECGVVLKTAWSWTAFVCAVCGRKTVAEKMDESVKFFGKARKTA